jgi:eukaryotic-like serine/threonine-protein kinase
MVITAGTRLGRYKILTPLGAGGMGEIYLAEDTELRRKIALKLLPAKFTSDSDRLRRFSLEAKAASALNHPNIITVYEVGQASTGVGDLHFIATEFVDGETVRQILRHAPPPLAETLDIAAQVAGALAAAHAAGVIHRDIKPENVMLRRDGYVKVLDFGLAKLTEVGAPGAHIPTLLPDARVADSRAETISQVNTAPGVVIGTVAYMSPEQARGLKVDARTDLFALGVMLYEMVAGRRPFGGATPQDIRAAILGAEPAPLSGAGEAVPPELERIVTKALTKNRDERYQTAKDLQIDLKRLRQQTEMETELKRAAEQRRSQEKTRPLDPMPLDTAAASWRPRVFRALLVALAAVAAGLLGWQWWPREQPPEPFQTQTVASWRSEPGDEIVFRSRLSPDGRLAAYCATRNGKQNVWLKQLKGGDPLPVTHDDWAYTSPIWSPDGEQVAFLADRGQQDGIWTMPAFGGTPTLLKTLEPGDRELVGWVRDGTAIYYSLDARLFTLDVVTHKATLLAAVTTTEPIDQEFNVSPDGRQVVYVDRQNGQTDLWVKTFGQGEPTRITNDAAEDGQPAWHPDGRRIIYSSSRSGIYQICVAYIDGRPPIQLTSGESHYWVCDVSSDGTQILYTTARDEADIWVIEPTTLKEYQLTSEAGAELWPEMSPDGLGVVFQASSRPSLGHKIYDCAIFVKPLQAEARWRQLVPQGFLPRWSPDGRQIAFLRAADGLDNLWTVQAGGGEIRQLTSLGIIFWGFSALPYTRDQGPDYTWSPDSRQIVFASRQSGRANIWAAQSDGTGASQLSSNSDPHLWLFSPLWSPDGQRVAYTGVRFPDGPGGRVMWSIHSLEAGRSETLLQSDAVLHLLGWLPSGNELLLKSVPANKDRLATPTAVSVLQLSLADRQPRLLTRIESADFSNLHLSHDRRMLAFTRQQDGEAGVWVMPVTGGAARKLTGRIEPKIYLSSLAWSPDSQKICYGRQANWRSLQVLLNFK